MLEGEHGRQRKEVRKLVRWIDREARPDVVHLSNAMLIGVAARDPQAGHSGGLRRSRARTSFWKRCPSRITARRGSVLRERARRFDALRGPERLLRRLHGRLSRRAARSGCDVIPHGLNLAGHGTRPARARQSGTRSATWPGSVPTRDCTTWWPRPSCLLADPQVPPFRVRAAGYLGQLDRPYLESHSAAGRRLEPAGAVRVRRRIDPSREDRLSAEPRHDVPADRCIAKARASACSKRWPMPCRWCCPTTADFPKWIEPDRRRACSTRRRSGGAGGRAQAAAARSGAGRATWERPGKAGDRRPGSRAAVMAEQTRDLYRQTMAVSGLSAARRGDPRVQPPRIWGAKCLHCASGNGTLTAGRLARVP